MTGSRPGQEALIISYFARRIAGRLASWRAMVQRRSSSSRSSLSSALSICATCQPDLAVKHGLSRLKRQSISSHSSCCLDILWRVPSGLPPVNCSTYLGFFELPQLVHVETSRKPVAPEGICDECCTRVDRWFLGHSLLLLHWNV